MIARGGSGARRAAFRPGVEADVIDDAPSQNAWPSGVRVVACLACDVAFTSSGRQERMCPACRRRVS